MILKKLGELGGARLRRQANRCRPFKPDLGNASEGNANRKRPFVGRFFYDKGLFLKNIETKIPALLEQVRTRRPVVHAITNWVTGGDVANVLQALGARPVLAVYSEEAAEITAQADALLLNLGTPDPDRIEAMVRAGSRANERNKSVVFDPVGAGASRFREEACRRILAEVRLAVIRGNRAEIGFLAGKGGRLRGIDAVAGPDDLPEAARLLSRQTGAAVAASGEKDLLVSGTRRLSWESGHPLMTRVTGTGCMLSAVITAFSAVEEDPLTAAAAGITCFQLAGRLAGKNAKGPGTFKAGLLDGLYALTPEDLQGSPGFQG
jgi:hydroxyethylthiazole kinase